MTDDQGGKPDKSKIILCMGRISSIKSVLFSLKFNTINTPNQGLFSEGHRRFFRETSGSLEFPQECLYPNKGCQGNQSCQDIFLRIPLKSLRKLYIYKENMAMIHIFRNTIIH